MQPIEQSRLSFRGRASDSINGHLPTEPNAEFLPGLGSPSALNDTLFTPTADKRHMGFAK